MSITYVNAELRDHVRARAEHLCEYCLVAEEDTCFGCEVDHIISEKRGGSTMEVNLCLACVFCNQRKGSDVGSIILESGQFVRLFNPRTDRWGDHFRLQDYRIEPRTDIGVVTARLLQFNVIDRLLERQALALVNRYPSAFAIKRMSLAP